MMSAGWLIAGGAALSVLGFGAGYQVNEWQHKSAELKAVKSQVAADTKARDKVDANAAKYETSRAAIQSQASQSRTKIREVYRNVEVPADCEPPADALRVLDNAIRQDRNSGKPAPALPAN